jgi:hypothetical protein
MDLLCGVIAECVYLYLGRSWFPVLYACVCTETVTVCSTSNPLFNPLIRIVSPEPKQNGVKIEVGQRMG